VTARGSSFSYRDSPTDIRTIASDLGVRYILEGSVRKNSGRVRVTVRLVDVESDAQLWAQRFDRVITDVFEVQDEITDLVMGALEPELGYAERLQIRKRSTESLNAWEHYQRGLDHMYQRTMEHETIAEQELRRAIELDSSFAAPRAALAYTLTQTFYPTHPQDVEAKRPNEAIEVSTQAIALDPGNALAYCALGRALNNAQQFDRGLDASKKAVQLNPSSATCVRNLGFSLLYSGNAEAAIPQFERAMLLSPRDPETWSICHGIAMASLAMRDFEHALVWAERALLAPNPGPWPLITQAASLGCLGRIEEAANALEAALARLPKLWSVELVRNRIRRYSRSAFVDLLAEGLERAGMPVK